MSKGFRHEAEEALVKEETSEICAPVEGSTINDNLLQSHYDTRTYKEKAEGNPEPEDKKLTIHQLSEEKYFCRVCAKAFGKPSGLMAHLRGHKECELHICNICPESFPSMLDLGEHMSGHCTQTGFHCPLCKCSFSTAAWLQRHNMNIHEANVPPSVAEDNHQQQRALREVACRKYAVAEFPNSQPLLLERVIVDRPEDKRSPGRQDCDESVLESKPSISNRECIDHDIEPMKPYRSGYYPGVFGGVAASARTSYICKSPEDPIMHRPAGKHGGNELAESNVHPCTSSNSSNLGKHVHGTHVKEEPSTSPDTRPPIELGSSRKRKQLQKLFLCPHSSEDGVLPDDHEETSCKGRKISNRECIDHDIEPMKPYRSGYYSGVFGGVAASARTSYICKSPEDHIMHRPAGKHGGNELAESNVHPCTSSNSSNLGKHVHGTHVKEEPSTSPDTRPPIEPGSSQKLFFCSHCGEDFHHKSTIDSHVATQSAVKPFLCTLCSEAGVTCLVSAEGAAGEIHSHRVLCQGEEPTSSAAASAIEAAKGGKLVKEQGSFLGHLEARSRKEERPNTSPQHVIQAKGPSEHHKSETDTDQEMSS